MPTVPDLSKLESDYQILTELHRSDDAHTFLARHLGLNRDVTITVLHGADPDALKAYDADTHRLVDLRHTNVIPVLEGRWLAPDEYAVVHARVRGSTLDQLVSAVGGMPLPRAANALQQVNAALDWARGNGIVNRHVTADELVFQQGSGRVFLALTPTSECLRRGPKSAPRGSRSGNPIPNACADAHTVGELAFMMLSGHRVEDAGTQSLSASRTDLPRAVIAQTEVLLRCEVSGVLPDVDAYIALLTPTAPATAPATAVSARQAASSVIAETEVPVQVARHADAVVATTPQGMSFGARFASAVLVLGVLGAAAALFVHRRGSVDADVPVASTATTAGGTEAAGDIALRARQSDSILAAQVPAPVVTRSVAMPVAPKAASAPASSLGAGGAPVNASGASSGASSPRDSLGLITPDARRHEPPRTSPRQTILVPGTSDKSTTATATAANVSGVVTGSNTTSAATTNATTNATTAPADSIRPTDVCDSPVPADQRTCLMNRVEKSDAGLSELYQRVVTGLRKQASVQPDDPDPASVEQLRATQRRWLEERDTQCRAAGTGVLFARERAACFADQADKRRHDLQQVLEGIPTTPPRAVVDTLRRR